MLKNVKAANKEIRECKIQNEGSHWPIGVKIEPEIVFT